MATLSQADRQEGAAEYMRDCSRDREPLELTKANMQAAYDAADTWANNNAAAFNSALPTPARTVLTTDQKARLMTHVIHRRWIKDV